MTGILRLFLDKLSTPIGDLRLVADERGYLRVVFFADHDGEIRSHLSKRYGPSGFVLQNARDPHGLTQSLTRYFAGELGAIDGLPVEAAGTSFQREVWQALRTIRCGTTTSYGKLAGQIGRPTAVRAVGAANGANPIAVVVPCHRVIGASGSLTGMERKRWLLEHEGSGSLPLF